MTDIMMYVYIAFGAVALIGFIIGIIKGLFRSLLEVAFVALNALLSGFGATHIAKAIVKPEKIGDILDLVKSKINLGENTLETINQVQTVLKNPEANTTAASLVIAAATVIVLPIIFMLLYIVFALILVIPKLIIQHVCIHKPRRGAARWSGGLVLALSNVIALAIFLIPIFGYADYANEALAALKSNEPQTVEQSDSAQGNDVFSQAQSYVEPIANSFVAKAVGAVGGDKLFEKLTTVEVDGMTVSLKAETDCAIMIYKEVDAFVKVAFKDYGQNQITAIENVEQVILDADFVPAVVANVLSYVATEWEQGRDVFGMAKPTVGQELQPSVDQIISTLAKTNTESFKKDVSTIVDVVVCCIDDKVLETALGENPGEMVNILEETSFLSDVLLALHKNERFRPAIPTVSSGIVNYVYRVYDEVNGTTTEKHEVINYDKLTEADVRVEGERISVIISEIDTFIASLEGVDLENDQYTALTTGDFAALGRAFNELRKSYLFKDTFEFLLKAILKSEACAQLGFIDDDFIQNATRVDADLEKMLVARQNLGILILALKDDDPAVYDSAIETILLTISKGEGESLESILTYSNLRSLGLSKEKSRTISGLLTSMVQSFDGMNFTPEQTKQEAEATGKIVNAINSVLDNVDNIENIFNVSDDEVGSGTSDMTADEFVETAINSEFVSAMIGNAVVDKDGNVVDDPYHIHKNMSQSDIAAIENAIANEYNKEGTKEDSSKVETLENIAHILGIDTSNIFN